LDLVFARVGGLSPVKYKRVQGKEPTFHYPPPRRRGIYAFVFPYVEPFLWAWSKENKQEFELNGYRKFTFDGHLWCHFVKEGKDYSDEIIGNWIRVHTRDFDKVFKKQMINDIKYLQNSYTGDPANREKHSHTIVTNPYKHGCNGFMSRDHLEIFIEASECAKIR
jgi:hypothetical protein